ncbi:MAG: CDP-alcohol phosphatidyltransferase family protein [Alphaproteobacteria bacterium]|nr:CDP-alcohol phosphatidyltransferase family protein [Alphaproteobacteria bacterium]
MTPSTSKADNADLPTTNDQTVVAMVGRSAIPIWGLTTEERLRRTIKSLKVDAVLTDGDALPETGSVVLIRADYALEDRLVDGLVDHGPGVILGSDGEAGGPRIPIAAHVEAGDATATAAYLKDSEHNPSLSPPATLAIKGVLDVGSAYNRKLRKREVPYALHVGPETIETIENRIFTGSYKGITDFVTKYLWPLPARFVTRQAVKLGLSPNMVTMASLVLVFVTLWLFMQGQFLTGLAVGFVMVFLDTVDGKLARVTLTSSKWGNVFDHGIDLIHPPFWWWAWWYGLYQTMPEAAAATPLLDVALLIVTVGYVIGRLEEGLFIKAFGIQMHTWRPIDSFFRLITARRNPNISILLVATLLGAPIMGFLLMALWTVLSLLFHAVRITQGFLLMDENGLRSYLTEPLKPEAAA